MSHQSQLLNLTVVIVGPWSTDLAGRGVETRTARGEGAGHNGSCSYICRDLTAGCGARWSERCLGYHHAWEKSECFWFGFVFLLVLLQTLDHCMLPQNKPSLLNDNFQEMWNRRYSDSRQMRLLTSRDVPRDTEKHLARTVFVYFNVLHQFNVLKTFSITSELEKNEQASGWSVQIPYCCNNHISCLTAWSDLKKCNYGILNEGSYDSSSSALPWCILFLKQLNVILCLVQLHFKL